MNKTDAFILGKIDPCRGSQDHAESRDPKTIESV